MRSLLRAAHQLQEADCSARSRWRVHLYPLLLLLLEEDSLGRSRLPLRLLPPPLEEASLVQSLLLRLPTGVCSALLRRRRHLRLLQGDCLGPSRRMHRRQVVCSDRSQQSEPLSFSSVS